MKLSVGSPKNVVTFIVVLLVLANLSQLFTSWTFSWLVAIVLICLLLLIANSGSLSLNELGLGDHTIKTGLIWGGLTVLATILVMSLVFLIGPALFKDSRYHNGLGHALYSALIIIPLHTVIVEELAFRGVLWAGLKRLKDIKFATIVSSIIFGLWHIVPSLNLNHTSQNVVGSGGASQILAIMGVVLVTTIAGIGFCELRRRSNSLIAPIMAHWAINGVAVILAALAWSR